MDSENILSRVLVTLCELGGVTVAATTSIAAPIADGGLGFDELDYLALLLSLEVEFDIELPELFYGDTAEQIMESISPVIDTANKS